MPPETTIQSLLADAHRRAADDEADTARKAVRIAWTRETVAALRHAQKEVEKAWDRRFDALPDDLDEEELEHLPAPPEQAALDAIRAELDAVVEHDRWPKALHWSV